VAATHTSLDHPMLISTSHHLRVGFKLKLPYLPYSSEVLANTYPQIIVVFAVILTDRLSSKTLLRDLLGKDAVKYGLAIKVAAWTASDV